MSVAQAEPADKKAISDAARLNWRLWTILQAEICAPECALPGDLRTNMLNLCNFIDKHMVDVLAHPSPDKLNVLIDINRQIAAGLLADVAPQDGGPEEVAVDGQGMGGGSQSI